jgi:hypothetical protein
MRELPLPGVGQVLAAGRELVGPGKLGTIEPAACGEFPFGLGRQLLAGPPGVGLGVRYARCTTGWSSLPRMVLSGPYGWRQLAPNLNRHHWLQSSRLTTRKRGAANTSDPALSMCGKASG